MSGPIATALAAEAIVVIAIILAAAIIINSGAILNAVTGWAQ